MANLNPSLVKYFDEEKRYKEEYGDKFLLFIKRDVYHFLVVKKRDDVEKICAIKEVIPISAKSSCSIGIREFCADSTNRMDQCGEKLSMVGYIVIVVDEDYKEIKRYLPG